MKSSSEKKLSSNPSWRINFLRNREYLSLLRKEKSVDLKRISILFSPKTLEQICLFARKNILRQNLYCWKKLLVAEMKRTTHLERNETFNFKKRITSWAIYFDFYLKTYEKLFLDFWCWFSRLFFFWDPILTQNNLRAMFFTVSSLYFGIQLNFLFGFLLRDSKFSYNLVEKGYVAFFRDHF